MWKKLSAVLKEINGYYEMLYTLNVKKKSVLVSVDMKLLAEIVKKEEEIAGLISRAESRRQSILVELSGVCGGLRPNANSRELYKYMPAELKPEFKERHEKLEKMVAKVKALSEDNTLLITSALSAVQFHLNQIGGSVVEPAYGEKGQEVVTKEQKFDFKA